MSTSTTLQLCYYLLSFFFNDTATTEIYTLSLHDALPISTMPLVFTLAFRNLFHDRLRLVATVIGIVFSIVLVMVQMGDRKSTRLNSSPMYLVCRLLLEKKKSQTRPPSHPC